MNSKAAARQLESMRDNLSAHMSLLGMDAYDQAIEDLNTVARIKFEGLFALACIKDGAYQAGNEEYAKGVECAIKLIKSYFEEGDGNESNK